MFITSYDLQIDFNKIGKLAITMEFLRRGRLLNSVQGEWLGRPVIEVKNCGDRKYRVHIQLNEQTLILAVDHTYWYQK